MLKPPSRAVCRACCAILETCELPLFRPLQAEKLQGATATGSNEAPHRQATLERLPLRLRSPVLQVLGGLTYGCLSSPALYAQLAGSCCYPVRPQPCQAILTVAGHGWLFGGLFLADQSRSRGCLRESAVRPVLPPRSVPSAAEGGREQSSRQRGIRLIDVASIVLMGGARGRARGL